MGSLMYILKSFHQPVAKISFINLNSNMTWKTLLAIYLAIIASKISTQLQKKDYKDTYHKAKC